MSTMPINHFFMRYVENEVNIDCVMYSLDSKNSYKRRFFYLGDNTYQSLSSITYDRSGWGVLELDVSTGKCEEYSGSGGEASLGRSLCSTRKKVLESITNSNMGILDQKIWEF